jgi:hypothetical protein
MKDSTYTKWTTILFAVFLAILGACLLADSICIFKYRNDVHKKKITLTTGNMVNITTSDSLALNTVQDAGCLVVESGEALCNYKVEYDSKEYIIGYHEKIEADKDIDIWVDENDKDNFKIRTVCPYRGWPSFWFSLIFGLLLLGVSFSMFWCMYKTENKVLLPVKVNSTTDV